MTERQWLAWTAPTTMLEWAGGKASERQLRLFAVACCRSIWEWLPDERCRAALLVAEAFAEGEGSYEKLSDEKSYAWNVGFAFIDVWPRPRNPISYVACNALQCALFDGAGFGTETDRSHEAILRAAGEAAVFASQVVAEGRSRSPSGDSAWTAAHIVARAEQCVVLRDIIGNPFRPLMPIAPSLLAYDNGLVTSLALAAYENRSWPSGHLAPERLAVLSDALEEASCTDASLLEHLRQPTAHVMGCWALDLILGFQ